MNFLILLVALTLLLHGLSCRAQTVKPSATSKVEEGGWSITDDSGMKVFHTQRQTTQMKPDPRLHPIRGQEPEPVITQMQNTDRFSRLEATGEAGVPTSIRALHVLNDNDREMLAHPTMGVRHVIDHYETRTRYVTDSYGNSIPQNYQVPIYRTEDYKVSKDEERQFTAELIDVAQRYELRERYEHMQSVLKHDGAEIELDNGWLVEVLNFSDDGRWSGGAKLMVTKHPHLSLPYVVLINETGHVLPGEIVAAI